MTPAARRCQARIIELFDDDLRGETGVLHGLALWRAPSGPPRIIRIGEKSPASEIDRFLLHLARARADAIITSGSNLRAEPNLNHFVGDGFSMQNELKAWRNEVRGSSLSPTSLVLTQGFDLDLNHPFFKDSAPRIIYTGNAAAEILAEPAQERGIRVVESRAPSLSNAIEWLRTETTATNITLEMGAHASRALYQQPPGIDELILSLYEEPQLPRAQQGDVFLELDELEQLLGPPSKPRMRREASGTWSFRRFRLDRA